MPDLRFTRDVLVLSCGGCGGERQVDRTRGAEATAMDTLRFCDAHLGCPTGSTVGYPYVEVEDPELTRPQRTRRASGPAARKAV